MKRKSFAAILLGVCLLWGFEDAGAWGPKARRSISLAALQLVRERMTDTFRAGKTSYDRDMIRGAEAGWGVIADKVPIQNVEQALNAVNHQIQVLREAKEFGVGSYFAYRMGTLSALVSDLVLPFGITFSAEDERLARRIKDDIDRRVEAFSFSIATPKLQPIQNPRLYFDKKRPFFEDDKRLLVDEYTRGNGYEGFLSEAAPVYFQRAVEAVADAWYSVLRGEAEPGEHAAAPILTEYFVNQIEYLLQEKGNLEYAFRTYDAFQQVNPDLMEPYLRLGDLFYQFGQRLPAEDPRKQTAIDRGVREWEIAYRSSGLQRPVAAKRLSGHYLNLGERFFRKAHGPDQVDSDLQDAQRAFNLALRYDRTSDEAADRISETMQAIADRAKRYKLQQQILSQATDLQTRAERSRLEQNYGDALSAYDQALNFLGTIDDEFRDVKETANDAANEVRKQINSVKTEIFDLANNAIEQGDIALQNQQYERAVDSYNRVEVILEDIQAAPGSSDAELKQDLLATAQEQIEQTEFEKQRFEQQQARPEINVGGN